MKIKEGLEIFTTDFWYDLVDGGYLRLKDILESPVEVNKVEAAIETLQDFLDSCEEQIEGFLQ
jgi:hypothetical protein